MRAIVQQILVAAITAWLAAEATEFAKERAEKRKAKKTP
jgi:hypothetical protein